MLQLPIEIDFSNADSFRELQNIDWEAMADVANNPAAQQAAQNVFWLAGWFMALAGIIVVVAIILTVLNLFNIWHWGMTDKAEFDKAGETKKKWFMIFFIVPLAAGLIGIIPFIGWAVAIIAYVYWAVMILIYFFGTRKKVGGLSSETKNSSIEM